MSPEQVKFPVALKTVQPVESDPPARRILPVPWAAMFTFPLETEPMLISPVVPASRLMAVAAVDTEMVGAVPVKVRAVEDVLMVSRLATPVRAPPVETLSPPLEMSWKVPVAFPMVVAPVPVVAMLTADAPAVARLVMPLDERVVKAPVEVVVAPMAVALIPVAVVLKEPEVMRRLAAPVEMEDSESPEMVRTPLVAVRFKAPVVRVRPLEAVRVEENLPVPMISRL